MMKVIQLTGAGNVDPQLNMFYEWFREVYSREVKFKWHYRTPEEKEKFTKDISQSINEVWGSRLSAIINEKDIHGNLIQFSDFNVAIKGFEAPGVKNEREHENQITLICKS